MNTLFPENSEVSTRLLASQLQSVITEFELAGYTLHLRPNYVSGAPQCAKDVETLADEAFNEWEAYHLAVSGAYGHTAKAQAEAWGLGRIAFMTWHAGGRLMVYDLLTRTMFKADAKFLSTLHHVTQ